MALTLGSPDPAATHVKRMAAAIEQFDEFIAQCRRLAIPVGVAAKRIRWRKEHFIDEEIPCVRRAGNATWNRNKGATIGHRPR